MEGRPCGRDKQGGSIPCAGVEGSKEKGRQRKGGAMALLFLLSSPHAVEPGTFRARLLPSVNPLRKHAHREPRVCFAHLAINQLNNQLIWRLMRRQTPLAFRDFPNQLGCGSQGSNSACSSLPPNSRIVVALFCLQCKGLNPPKALGMRGRCSNTDL